MTAQAVSIESAESIPSGMIPHSVCPSRSRPVDLVHLARQTAGDRVLEAEVLSLMAHQIVAFSGRLDLASADERKQIAHALKGAARNVGAFPLSQAAERLEQSPSDLAAGLAFEAEMHRTAEFIAGLRR